jgi:hypothetical protein
MLKKGEGEGQKELGIGDLELGRDAFQGTVLFLIFLKRKERREYAKKRKELMLQPNS